jgi:primase-polymerase (primpol)-like protein
MSGTGANGSSPTVDAGGAAAAVTEGQARPKFLQPNFELMPSELKLLKNWVLWVPIWNGSKWTKRPIQVSGFGASTTSPKHWSSFDDVKRAYERAFERGCLEIRERGKPIQQVPIGGVGFVFNGKPDDHGLVYAGVDFDNEACEGERSIHTAEWVDSLGSYSETSVSGRGLHVILKAKALANGIAYRGVELYTQGRFFTMTGHVVRDTRIVAAAEEFATFAREVRNQSSKTAGADELDAPHEEEELTSEEAANGTWLSKLPP